MLVKHEQMRSNNALLILDHIRQHGGSTRRNIQKSTQLSWAAVSNISASLVSKSILYEIPCNEKSMGRLPGYLDFVPMRNLTIGVEITVGGLIIVLMDLRCNFVDYIVEPLQGIQCQTVLDQIFSGVERMIQRHNLTPDCLLGLGIATQGSVDRDGTASLYNSFFTDWRDVPLKKMCEERFSIPVRIMHDPVCVALAEQWQRRFSDESQFAVLRLSYGIGMSCVVHGLPVRGNDGFSGEVGHMMLDPHGPQCSCGNRGCMESYASIRGIFNRVMADYQDEKVLLPSQLQDIRKSSPAFVLAVVRWCAEQARAGEERMLQYFSDAGYFLGIGIANIVNLFNPESVILTGRMLEFSDLFLDRVKETVESHRWKLSRVNLLVSDSDQWQAAIGAGLYFINDAFRSLQSPLLADSSV